MTDSTIFTQATPDAALVTPPASTTTLPQEVIELVGQGKKYATVDDALKSVPHAQKHIKTLEEELASTKAELEKRKTAEQLLDEIKSGMKPAESPSAFGQITSDNVAQIVEQTLVKKTQEQVVKTNISKVTSAFSGKYGEKAEEAFKTLAKDTGMSVDELNRLSATSPNAVLQLAGITGKQVVTGGGRMSSSVNTDGLAPTDQSGQLSARVKQGASTKDLVNAWKIAGQKVGKPT